LDKGSEVFKSAVTAAIPGQQGFDYLIVGAGFAGSVLAERLATVMNQRGLTSGAMPTTGTTTPAC
jgi:UDP-galactopyranose mutase